MMHTVPENLASVQSPGGPFTLAWDSVNGVQVWQLVRCDYPLSVQNGVGLLSGGLDLMVSRFELNPSVCAIMDDTGVDGKHYAVLGLTEEGELVCPDNLRIESVNEPLALSSCKECQGWIKGISKKDRYSGVF